MVVGEFTQEVDVLVIGAGPAGYTAAFRAAQLGKQVALVDPRPQPGGACLHEACIPSKSALLGRDADSRKALVETIGGALVSQCRSLGVEFLQGRAKFEGDRHVQVAADEVSRVRFRRAIIATGSQPRALEGLPRAHDRVHDAADAYGQRPPAGRVLVVGSDRDAVEAASSLAQSARVTLAATQGPLLPGADRDLVQCLERSLETSMGGVHADASLDDICLESGVRVVLDGHSTTFDHVVVAIGRVVRTEPLALGTTGVELNEHGAIVIDERCATSDPRIFAAGEVTSGVSCAAVALAQGRIAAENACGGDASMDAAFPSQAVWSDPGIAWCGLGEDAAAATGIDCQVTSMNWGASGFALAMRCEEGRTKLVYDGESQLLLGVGIVGRGAPELICEAALALEMGATLYDLATTLHPHPTRAELLSLAARAALD